MGDPSILPHARAAEPDTERLARSVFFIIGAPRSGTTLLQSILASHPNIAIPPETEFFMKFADPKAIARWDDWLGTFLASRAWTDQGLDGAEFRRRAEQTDRKPRSLFLVLLSMHAERTGKARVGEKSPQHARWIERIEASFPGAKYIHIYRDPRDVVASRLRVPWTSATHLGLARSWVKDTGAAARHEAIIGAARFASVRYETLVADIEGEARRLCDFLGEPFGPEMLRFHERDDAGFADRERAWKGATRRPAGAASIGRFERDLSARQIAGIERIAGPLMTGLGYECRTTTRKPAWVVLDALDRARDRTAKLRRSIAKRLGQLPPEASSTQA